MDEEELYKIYEAHRNQGASHDEAMQAVQMAQEGKQAPDAELAAQKRLSAGGGSAMGDFARMMAQGATFGFGDELAGALDGGTEKSRQRIADLRKLAPGASTMAEIAGSSVLPIGAGGEAMTAGGGLLKGAAAGALGGAVQGGASGMGEATGSLADRLPAAKKGALVGAAIGAPLGAAPAAVNAFMRGSKGVPARLVDLLRSTTGAEGLYDATKGAAAAKKAAGEALGALDAANPSISDPAVIDALSNNRFTQKAVRRLTNSGALEGGATRPLSLDGLSVPPISSPEEKATIELGRRVAAAKASGQPIDGDQIGTLYKTILDAQQPRNDLAGPVSTTPATGTSLKDVRTVLQELRDAAARAKKKPITALAKGYGAAEQELKGATGDVVPGFRDTMQGYAKAADKAEGLGVKGLANKTPDELKLMFEGQYPEMQQGMRTRAINDIASQVSRKGDNSDWLQGMIQREPDTLLRLRSFFPDGDAGDAAFSKLTDQLALEQSAAKTRAGAWTTAKVAGVGATGAGLLKLLSGS